MRKHVSSMQRTPTKSPEFYGATISHSDGVFRGRVGQIFSHLEKIGDDSDFVFPFFDDGLFELLQRDIRSQEVMTGLPEGYGSELQIDRLRALAATRIILRPNNMEIQADTHNKTIENYIKLALLAAGDKETAKVFLATLIADMEVGGVDEYLAQQIFWLWAPFADIIGLKDIKHLLEEQAMKAMMPEEYERIDGELNGILGLGQGASKVERAKRLEAEAQELEDYLNSEFNQYDIRINVTSRVKSHYAIWQKQQSSGTGGQPVIDTIYDYLGFRIVVSPLVDDPESVIDACRAVDTEVRGYFGERTWHVDYTVPRLQSHYKAIHSTYLLPDGMFAPNVQAEVQVRSRKQEDHLEADDMAYHDYSAKKPVPGKNSSEHVKRVRHRIYDWRAKAAIALFNGDKMSAESILNDDEQNSHVLVFDKYANLHLAASNETALDAVFRIHSDKAFRLSRLYSGQGYIDDKGRAVGLRPLNIRSNVWHGMRVVAKYGPKGSEILHEGWKDVLVRDRAKRRVLKRIKEVRTEEYIESGVESVRAALEKEKLGVNHLRDLDDKDWAEICRRSGLATNIEGLTPRQIVLREIGSGSIKAGRVVARVQFRRRLALDANRTIVAIIESGEGAGKVIKVDGVDAVQARCCENLPNGSQALLIASMSSGARTFKLHNCACHNMATLWQNQDPRLIVVNIKTQE